MAFREAKVFTYSLEFLAAVLADILVYHGFA
jgi:hypothetical protein